MELNKILDYAIMADETADNPAVKSGYKILGKDEPYFNYIENNCWNEFKKDMEKNYPDVYAECSKVSDVKGSVRITVK